MEETKTTQSKLDLLIWVVILLLTAGGVVANAYFKESAWSLRFASWIMLAGILVGLGSLTAQGKKIWAFTKEAKMELLKVVWPTRDETVKTTAVVAALVFVMAIILWLVDSSLLWVVSWFTR